MSFFLSWCDFCYSFFVPCQIRWTKTAGSATDRFQDSSVFNETLRITRIQRHQGGRYYCKAENGLGTPAIKSIRVDVYCELTSSSACRQKKHTLLQVNDSLVLAFADCACISLLAFEAHTQPWFSTSLKSSGYESWIISWKDTLISRSLCCSTFWVHCCFYAVTSIL